MAAGEVSLGDVLRDWSTRLAADINVKKFRYDSLPTEPAFSSLLRLRREIAASTAFPYLVEQLLEADLDQSTVGAIETFLCDFFGPSFKVLPINLRAMYHMYGPVSIMVTLWLTLFSVNQMGGGAKAREVRDMVMKHVTRALSPADSQAPQQLTQDQLQTWLEFVATVNKEPALKGAFCVPTLLRMSTLTRLRNSGGKFEEVRVGQAADSGEDSQAPAQPQGAQQACGSCASSSRLGPCKCVDRGADRCPASNDGVLQHFHVE